MMFMKNVFCLVFLCFYCLQISGQANPVSGSFVDYTENAKNLNIAMVAVKSGMIMMGCTPEQGSDCKDAEKPAHRVKVDNFFIGKYEVTQAQWKAVMGNEPSYYKGANLPVERVSWNDIQEFISKLNTLTGKQYRLLTEAEWEFAARGGLSSKGYKYSGSNTADEVAWIDSNSAKTTHEVGTKNPNELGIYDMSGNVLEWCNDWLSQYTDIGKVNPKGANSGSHRVGRGGSWSSQDRVVRVSARSGNAPDSRAMNLGFRLACPSK
jgi:formylglycine-generating enzyme required for sulfatase activity